MLSSYQAWAKLFPAEAALVGIVANLVSEGAGKKSFQKRSRVKRKGTVGLFTLGANEQM